MNFIFTKISYEDAIIKAQQLLDERGYVFTAFHQLTKYTDIELLINKFFDRYVHEIVYNDECKCFKRVRDCDYIPLRDE